MTLSIICTTICILSTFVVIKWCIKITKQIHSYKDGDWSNYQRTEILLRDQQRLFENSCVKQREQFLDLGIQVEQMKEKLKKLEIHVFSVMQSAMVDTLYKEKGKKNND
jgi:hypothetical protein